MTVQMHPTHPMSLFDRYGGIRVLRHVISDFYERALDSDVIGDFFEDIDMARLIDHQTKFFTMLLGGPANFSDQRLANAHKHLRLQHVHFDEVVTLMTDTLKEAGFSNDDVQTVVAAIEARRAIIVS